MFLLPDGRTYHVGLRKGEFSPLMLTVGSEGRALFLATRLLKEPVMTISPRRFCLHTGKASSLHHRVSIGGEML